MRIGPLQLEQLPLVFLDFLLYILFVVLDVLELCSHFCHYGSVTQGGRRGRTVHSDSRVDCLLKDNEGLSCIGEVMSTMYILNPRHLGCLWR